MKLGFHKKPQTFAEWLYAATCHLVPSAQARVRPEIEAHYAEAVKSHLDEGSSDSEAQNAALKELGDAYKAAKRFRREYLTPEDTQAIDEILESNQGLLWNKSSRFWQWFFFAYIMASIMLTMLKSPARSPFMDVLAWLEVMGWAGVVHNLAKLAAYKMVGPSRTPASLRQLLLIRTLGRVAFWLPFLGSLTDFGSFHFFYLLLVFAGNRPDLSLWLGLRKKLCSATADDLTFV